MPKAQMLINYVPGEECRVAVVEDGKLEEFYSEPTSAVSRVNNIYVGRVTNVEAGIQAAFVDFGIGVNGFLHVSDLHPMYFPGEGENTRERVGMKTPRRDRPPIQHALKRGQEIIVQVLKEGVGTKGPTLTSYLSIPGRFLVMMPQMDRVGVSRKLEDDDTRRKMIDTLKQLELPEDFGFILRTAGLERTKAELKRDLAYLQRLWKDMERRRKTGNKPRLLYSESDLLVRTLRDVLTSDINEVVIDHEMALRRAARFMKIVAPRAQARLLRYTGPAPIFHAFGIERQITDMLAREVPLPSGGRLVIDETEAVVAIDVNSGRMRDARDPETTAYRTNVEAVDEICRQLRLRDLGGLVIHDLIDMRSAKHRKDIEQRFKERLKRDRARTTILPISAFGIMEMTRQRMRGSHESVHFSECQTCRGRGLVQKPGSVAADAMRELAALLDAEKVARIELVVGPRVAGELLSGRRQSIARIERRSGKRIDVRVSESLPIDRVTFYAYDEAGADINIDKLPPPKAKPTTEQWVESKAVQDWAVDPAEEAGAEEHAEEEHDTFEDDPIPGVDEDADEDAESGSRKKRRRRRRRRKSKAESESDTAEDRRDTDESQDAEEQPSSDDESQQPRPEGDEDADGPTRKKKRRRRRRRRKGGDDATQDAQPAGDDAPAQDQPATTTDQPRTEEAEQSRDDESRDDTDDGPTRKKRRRRSRRKKVAGSDATTETDTADREPAQQNAQPEARPEPQPAGTDADQPPTDTSTGAKKKSRSRRKKTSTKAAEATASEPQNDARADNAEPTPKTAKRKTSRKTSKKSTSSRTASDNTTDHADTGDNPPTPVTRPARTLYASRRKLSPAEKARLAKEKE